MRKLILRKTALIFLAAGIAFLGFACVKSQQAEDFSTSETSAACLCEKGKAGETVWCDKCGAGYVGGEKIKCPGKFKAKACGKDASACKNYCKWAGKTASPDASAACLCEKGKAGETVWCDKCGAGYVGGEKIKCPGKFKAKVCGKDASACKNYCKRGDKASSPDADAACLCEKGKAGETLWCNKCGAGYVGEKITCPGKFKAMSDGMASPPCQRGGSKGQGL